ncbi:MAG TPA: SCP2 sterol-binding domain-containing protein [Saprospiraceae bacterium]|nr:SCP2 sterol-binding domain-containing protein [Saprospiraceae bacterium]
MTVKEFLNNLPNRVEPEALAGKESLFHFEISGEDGGDYTVKIADNQIEVMDGLVGDAKCTVKAKSKNFLKVINGETKAMMAVMMGKVKISNLSEMMEFAKYLGF